MNYAKHFAIPSLSIVIPTRGDCRSLERLLPRLKQCKRLRDNKFSEINLSFVFSINTSARKICKSLETFATRYSCTSIFFNGRDLGYDQNVLLSYTRANGQYCHFLSDNDYYSSAHWHALFDAILKIPAIDISRSCIPVILLPLPLGDIDELNQNSPNWLREGTQQLMRSALSGEIHSTYSFSVAASAVLLSSQISRAILRVDKQLIPLLKSYTKSEPSLECGGIAQSVIAWFLLENQVKQFECMTILPFLDNSKCLSPLLNSRSIWFYESTFQGLPNVYNNLSLTARLVGIPSDFIDKTVVTSLIDYINSFGLALLKYDVYQLQCLGNTKKLKALNRIFPVNTKFDKPSVFRKLKVASLFYIKKFIFRFKLFLLRFS